MDEPMTSQPVEQRGDFKEWNYTETHLPVRRVDEHNACVTALRAALAREAELREALRKRIFIYSKNGRAADWETTECLGCGSKWQYREPEAHALGCLAKLDDAHE